MSPRNGILTLTTDFGSDGPYVAAVHFRFPFLPIASATELASSLS